ncbi:MAG: enoyl-CoA hydratase/isomerase family protein, partial [Candidatus Angelobacter sp.]
MATGALPETDLTGDTRVPAKPLKYIQFDIAGCIARLTMNHAPHNVLIVPMMKEMAEAIESLNGRTDVKTILLQSSQQAFSAGISLEDSRPDRVFQTLDAFTRVFQAMVDISKPVVVV